MFDRRTVRDVAIAICLAAPTVALSRPQASLADHPNASPLVEKAAFANRTSVEKLADLPAAD